MKFSVVIPCHDRLELLKEAIYTIQHQEWNDWELYIFDNGSQRALGEYIEELKDSRIRYDRSDVFLPVMESWNRAIEMASGDYTIFLGDDDGLTPNYFSRMAAMIEKFESPEIVYSAFYQFMHPGVAPWAPGGYVAEVKNGFFFVDRQEPFLLSQEQAFKAAKGSLKFRRNFTFNIQTFVFSRRFLQRLKQEGPIFQSPFPDYYIANVIMAKSQSILIIPQPMSIAGVCKASVGYTLFNGLEDRFAEILNTKLSSDHYYPKVKDFLLPGPLYNSNYLLTMQYVEKSTFSILKSKVDFGRYRRLQIYHLILANMNQGKSPWDLPCWNDLYFLEKAWALGLFYLLKCLKPKLGQRWILPRIKHLIEAHAFHALTRTCDQNNHKQLVEVFHDLEKQAFH